MVSLHIGSTNAGAFDAEVRARGLRALTGAYLAFAAGCPESDGRALCPYRHLTGHRCPLCGLTRGIRLALRGRIADSAKQHPLAPLVAPLLLSGLLIGPSTTTKVTALRRKHAQ